MRLAVIADVHANFQALTAVLDAIEVLRPDRLLCLGDTVGYNANPNECVALVRARADVVVAGNHDRDVLSGDPVIGTTTAAKQAQVWTRQHLADVHKEWLRGLPASAVEPNVYIAVHGCYLNTEHVNGYVTPTMLELNLQKIEQNPAWPLLAFCGHTHQPMLAFRSRGRTTRTTLQSRTEESWPSTATAVLINPGSVGQPRDHDPRASFAWVDTDARTVQLERVGYDVAGAMAAIAGTDLPVSLAERLAEGR